VLRKIKRLQFRPEKEGKGQSFVELAVVFLVLIAMLVAVVEAGNLLNQYINLVDGAREAARAASNASPFISSTSDEFNLAFYTNTDNIIEGTDTIRSAISPVVLDPANGDDVVISTFEITKGVVKRFPQDKPSGWSHYGHASAFSDTDLQNLMTKFTAAPNTGMVVVEIFYNYETILGVPPSIPVHTYAIMPLTAAEATPTACTGTC
jgi:hypothetical protein